MDQKMMSKLSDGRQYRATVNLSVKDDGEERIVEGYASTFNQPYTLYRSSALQIDEQVDVRAFDGCDMSDVIMQYDHAGKVYARVSNGTLIVSTDEHGLFVRANLGGTVAGRELYEEIKGGYTCKMSFGFTIDEYSESRTEDVANNFTRYLRTITKIGKLYDVSAVSLPANDATEISARGYVDGVISAVQTERSDRERRAARIAYLTKLIDKEES